MNKFQILGIVAVSMALVSVCTFYLNKPSDQSIVKSTMFPQLILAGAVIVCSVALLLSGSSGSGDSKDSYVPHVYPTQPPMHHQPHYQQPPHQDQDQGPGENFIMREGLPKKDGKSLGRRLKEAGWEVCLADWCGFCTRQKDLFKEHPEEELDLVGVKEEDMTAEHQKLNEGFPLWVNLRSSKTKLGLQSLEQIAALLELSD